MPTMFLSFYPHIVVPFNWSSENVYFFLSIFLYDYLSKSMKIAVFGSFYYFFAFFLESRVSHVQWIFFNVVFNEEETLIRALYFRIRAHLTVKTRKFFFETTYLPHKHWRCGLKLIRKFKVKEIKLY